MVLLFLLGITAIATISILFNSTTDLAFITYAPSMLVILFATVFVAQIIKYAYPNDTINEAKKVFIAVVIVQIVLALSMFLVPSIGNRLNNLQILNDADRELLLQMGEFRLSGFGARFFGAGITNCYALIMLASLVRSQKLSRLGILYYAASFGFILAFGMMMSRTTLIGFCLALVFLLFPLSPEHPMKNRIKKQRKKFLFYVAALPALAIALVVAITPRFVEAIWPTLQFAFESFINLSQNGKFESKSTTALLDMYTYDPNLPLFIGDGYFTDPINIGQYYKDTDVGYLRLIYYSGLSGLITYLIFQYQAIKLSAVHLGRNEGRRFVLICIILLLALNTKGFSDLFMFSMYLYACTFRFESLSPGPEITDPNR